MILLDLFVSFFKTGLFMFGGGISMLPLLEKECCSKHNWLTKEEMLDMYTIGQCTPGVIAVNTATFVGYNQKKTAGAVVATAGIILPSFIIITAIALLFSIIPQTETVAKIFNGIRVAVCAIAAKSFCSVFKAAVKKYYHAIICILTLGIMIITNISPVIPVLAMLPVATVLVVIQKKRHGL